MAATDQEQHNQAEALYEQYAKPLEAEYWGEYVAVSPVGQTVVGADLLEVSDRALARFGPGGFLFKVGDKALGKWR